MIWEVADDCLVVGWVHKPVALIGEKRLGQGALIATTFRLMGSDDPVADALLDALIAQAANMAVDSGT
jgi:hypothetical protein